MVQTPVVCPAAAPAPSRPTVRALPARPESAKAPHKGNPHTAPDLADSQGSVRVLRQDSRRTDKDKDRAKASRRTDKVPHKDSHRSARDRPRVSPLTARAPLRVNRRTVSRDRLKASRRTVPDLAHSRESAKAQAPRKASPHTVRDSPASRDRDRADNRSAHLAQADSRDRFPGSLLEHPAQADSRDKFPDSPLEHPAQAARRERPASPARRVNRVPRANRAHRVNRVRRASPGSDPAVSRSDSLGKGPVRSLAKALAHSRLSGHLPRSSPLRQEHLALPDNRGNQDSRGSRDGQASRRFPRRRPRRSEPSRSRRRRHRPRCHRPRRRRPLRPRLRCPLRHHRRLR